MTLPRIPQNMTHIALAGHVTEEIAQSLFQSISNRSSHGQNWVVDLRDVTRLDHHFVTSARSCALMLAQAGGAVYLTQPRETVVGILHALGAYNPVPNTGFFRLTRDQAPSTGRTSILRIVREYLARISTSVVDVYLPKEAL